MTFRTESLSLAFRVLLWIGCLLTGAAAVGVTVWGLTGTVQEATRDRLEATLLPAVAMEHLAAQFQDLELFASFNFPLLAVGVTLLWLWGTIGTGAWITRHALDRSALPLERLVFSFGAGFVTIGLLALLAGVAGLARPWALTGLLVLAAVAAIPRGHEIAGWVRAAGTPFHHPLTARAGRNLLVAFVLLLLFATFLAALTPPIQSDGLRYHLGAPQEFLKAGRIGYLPWNAFSNFPFLADMHFMIALAAGAPEASQLMQLVLALATALTIAAFVQRFVQPLHQPAPPLPASDSVPPAPPESTGLSPALLAACTWLAVPAGLILAAWPFIDHAVAFFFLASLYALLLAVRRSSAGTWTLAGLMIGGAIGTKYTAIPHAALLGGLALLDWVTVSPPSAARSRRTIQFHHLLLAAAVAAAVGGVWFAKSALLTGNPVYPLAGTFFPGGDWTEASTRLYRQKTEEKGAEKTFVNLLRSPVSATLSWTRYERQFLGPLLLVTLTAALVGTAAAWLRHRSRARPLLYTLLVVLGYYGVWFYSYQSNRMLLPFLAMALPLAAAFVQECVPASTWLRRLAVLPFVIGIVYGGLWAVQWQYVTSGYPVIRYLLGDMSREEYLIRTVPYYRAFQEQARLVRPGEKVLLVGEHRIFYADFPAVWSDWFDTPAVLGIMREARAENAARLMAELRRRGIRWILYNEHELSLGQPPQSVVYFRPRFRDMEWRILQDLLAMPELERRTVPPGIHLLRLPDTEETR